MASGGELFFANATHLRTTLLRLDASAIPRIDTTAADVLHDLVGELEAAGVTFVVARATHGLRSNHERFGLLDVGVEVIDSVAEAADRFQTG